MKISEIFYSIQGEIDVGKPAIFIRLSGCNLIKDKKGCKFCDSLYAEKGKDMSYKQIIKELEKYNCKNIIITGGEPLHQKNELKEFLVLYLNTDYQIDIETNGTIFDGVLYEFENINCSPKKQNINSGILKKYNALGTRFKFVYENKKDLWWEEVIKDVRIDPSDVWIMVEGKTKKEQEKKIEEVIEYCKKKNYNYTPRLHVLLWGNKKGK